MRAIWSGSVSFGLVNIPIKLYSASTSRRLDFDMLRKKDLCPVGYVRVCKETGEQVAYSDIVKGYEFKKGDYVVLTDEDFKAADVKKTESIEIVDFAKEKELESKFFEKPYFLEPQKGASKVYALLREALFKSGKVGIARYVLRSSEHLGVVKVERDVLMLIQMRFAHEIRKPEEISIPQKTQVSQKELDMALSLIDQLTEPFRIERYKDTYIDELRAIIDRKVKGKETQVPKDLEPRPTKMDDIMDKLRESLERTKASGYASA